MRDSLGLRRRMQVSDRRADDTCAYSGERDHAFRRIVIMDSE
ncbi:hypothetical protein PAMC26577_37390 [Caballeronia sordidicola]|uniref:Uncharacterized protein n=1 Tax=Caballeronia sordidicola TaxID=196367 RepID=A0A242M5U7_CABSO|nr:hypothetical protein PAMC26577_37390 [Caballeronia sordidicola]